MSIYKKLLKFQEEVGAVAKDSLNPHFKNKYFDINNVLEEIKPILTKHGLVVTQPLKEDAVFSVITDVETGEDIQSFLHFDPSEKNPQKIGSIITYYRRYTLCSLLGIAGEDDDAEQAKTPTPKPIPKAKVVVQPTVKEIEEGRIKMIGCDTMAQLGNAYVSFTPELQKELTAKKDELKVQLKIKEQQKLEPKNK